ncbi:MAG: hypothetical protein AAF674_03990 [Pseudomonadota bacterium]
MFKDDKMISVFTVVVLLIAFGTLLQRADGTGWFSGEDSAPDPPPTSAVRVVALFDEQVRATAGQLVRIPVLENDLGIGPEQERALTIVREPSCGQLFVQGGALQYLPDAGCSGRQNISYTVPGAPDGVIGTTTVVVVAAETETAPPGGSLPPLAGVEPSDVALQPAPAGTDASVEVTAVEAATQSPPTPSADLPGAEAARNAPVVANPELAPGTQAVPSLPSTSAPAIPDVAPEDADPDLVAVPGPASGQAPNADSLGPVPAAPTLSSQPVPEIDVVEPPEITGVAQSDTPLDSPPGAETSDGATQSAPIALQGPGLGAAGGEPSSAAPTQQASAPATEPTYTEPALGNPSEEPIDVGTLAAAGSAPQAAAPSTEARTGSLSTAPTTTGTLPANPTVPAPDPVLSLNDPAFRRAPTGSQVSGSPREWMRRITRAATPADTRPVLRDGGVLALAENDAPAADFMVVVFERREPVNVAPAPPAGSLSPDRDGLSVFEAAPGGQGTLQTISLPQPSGTIAGSVLGAALPVLPLDGAQGPLVTPTPEEDQPLPPPAPRGVAASGTPENAADVDVAALPAPDLECTVPPSMTLDVRRAGRTIVSIVAPCQAGSVGELTYSQMKIAMPLDRDGRGQITALGFEPNAPAVLDLPGAQPIDFDLPFKGMNRVSRVALVWDHPIDLELNALEFGATLGSTAHVNPLNRRDFDVVRRDGGGFLTSYRGEAGRGQNIEIYSYYKRPGGPVGAVQLLVEFSSRSRDRLDTACGDGPYAAPGYRVLRTDKGAFDRPTQGRLAAIACSDVAPEVADKQLISGAVADLLVIRD